MITWVFILFQAFLPFLFIKAGPTILLLFFLEVIYTDAKSGKKISKIKSFATPNEKVTVNEIYKYFSSIVMT